MVHPGIVRIPIPLRARVEPANVWLLRDGDSWLLFDTGIAVGIVERLTDVLLHLGSDLGSIRRIVVSHHHPDHIGGSGPVHRATNAPVFASASTIDQGPDVWGDGGRIESYFESVRAHVLEHGFPAAIADALLQGELDGARIAVDLPPEAAWQVIEDGRELVVDGRVWRVLNTPGHADGHLVLYAPTEGWLLAGDHLLERISPAVGRFPRHDADPLGSYLASLNLVAGLDATHVLPGHGVPFSGATNRAQQLIEHHAARVDACVDAVRELDAPTAFEVARHVFAHVFEREVPDLADQRFATTEALAHLERACVTGRLSRARETNGMDVSVVRFRRAPLVASDPVR